MKTNNCSGDLRIRFAVTDDTRIWVIKDALISAEYLEIITMHDLEKFVSDVAIEVLKKKVHE